MTEPAALAEARRLLAQAEAGFRAPAALDDLERALELLEQMSVEAPPRHRTIAMNLAASYRARLYGRIEALVADRAAPEPELEHLLKIVFAFDRPLGVLPESASVLKIALVRRLIDRYYEGHPAAAKARALEQLAALERDAGG